jgi:sacsin
MNAAIFQDAEEKKRDKQLHAERVTELLNVKWVPIFTEPPSPYLPWPETCESVAAPVDTILMDKMWLASYSKRIVDGDMHSNELRKMFGWLNDISIKDISLQLRMLSSTFESLRLAIESDNEGNESITMNSLCQTVSAEVGRLYHILNSIESDYEIDVMKSVLHGSDWLWMGNAFVSSDHVAFTSSINATPYLHTVPPDVACFKNLLGYFNVRVKFGSSDYCHVLSRMAENQSNETKLSEDEIELAVTLVQKISDDILRLRDFEIYAPTLTGQMIIACKLVYDDAPWLSKDLGGKKELTYAHPKLSASVCDKIGVQSVRNVLLQSSADMIKFGDTVVHESFGQSESLTRRLKVRFIEKQIFSSCLSVITLQFFM